ncbi:MAG: hypothetical protein HUU20_11000 [Pirellulales bacterium]|nr:hypothetical protein [Pirellulales bacterium]
MSNPVEIGVTREFLVEQLELAESLRAGGTHMLEPQDLPGRYGRVIRALDRLLGLVQGGAVVAGGWAVWRHGYVGRVTQDVDIVVPAAVVEELLRVAAVSGFEVLPRHEGTWPKLHHKESNVDVDLLPEGATPGTPSRLAPTVIPHPSRLGAQAGALKYIELDGLVELKLAAGRARDESDVVELILANPTRIDAIRQHLAAVHELYLERFNDLVARAQDQSAR